MRTHALIAYSIVLLAVLLCAPQIICVLGSSRNGDPFQQSAVARNREDNGHISFPHLKATDAELGIVNVVSSPYNADPLGQHDSTAAIQSAVNHGRIAELTVFIPAGTYTITDTLNCSQHRSGYFHPIVMVGAGGNAKQQRAVFRLPSNTPGFTDPDKPKYLVHYWEDNALSPDNSSQRGETPKSNILTNVHYNQVFQSIDIDLGEGNYGAIGIRLRGAQGCNIEDVRISAGDSLIGIVGASGSGGSHSRLSITGGKYALDFRMAQPAPTLTSAYLKNQTCAALIYSGLQTLTVVGVQINPPVRSLAPSYLGHIASVPPEEMHNLTTPWLPSSGPCALPVLLPDPQPSEPAISGQISLIDVSIVTAAVSSRPAVSSPRSLYMRNVYVSGCQDIALLQRQNPGGPNSHIRNPSVGPDVWTHVEEAAFTVQPPIATCMLQNDTKVKLQYESTVWKDGTKSSRNVTLMSSMGRVPPPSNLVLKHTWNSTFPSFETIGATNVKVAPYNAIGDGVHDDTDAIQRAVDNNEIVLIPKGKFLLTSTLKLRANTKLIGVGHTLSMLHSAWMPLNNTKRGQSSPLVETASGAGSTVIAFLYIATLHPASTYGFLWQVYGQDCIMRQVICRTTIFFYGWEERRESASNQNVTHPLMVISGGGKFYTLGNGGHDHQMPSYRHILVVNSTAGASFYHLNAEHGRGDANVEIRASSNVSIYGFKSEGNFVAMLFRNSNNTSLYGFGGNAAAFPVTFKYPAGYTQATPSLFRIENCKNLRIANVMDFTRSRGGNATFFAGEGVDPRLWTMILDQTLDRYIPPLDRPVLYYWQ
eukprot:scpid60461/ scgid31570/ 